jgi:hypothetical protein
MNPHSDTELGEKQCDFGQLGKSGDDLNIETASSNAFNGI